MSTRDVFIFVMIKSRYVVFVRELAEHLGGIAHRRADSGIAVLAPADPYGAVIQMLDSDAGCVADVLMTLCQASGLSSSRLDTSTN